MALANHAASTQPEPGLDRARFIALWLRVSTGGGLAGGAGVFDRVLAHYREPQRFYHTPEHIRHCLSQFDLARAHMHEPDAVELALWFHDVIYDPEARDNESRSAALFETLAAGRLLPGTCRKVRDLIMVTVHPSLPSDHDARFVVDIDLSSFALPWARFRSDSEAVRREMAHLDDREFYHGQIRFLQGLLARRAFFCSEFFYRRSEARARGNITRYLAELAKRGYSLD